MPITRHRLGLYLSLETVTEEPLLRSASMGRLPQDRPAEGRKREVEPARAAAAVQPKLGLSREGVVHPTDETGHCERAICLFLSTSYEPALAKNPPLPLRSLRVTQVTTSRTNRATTTGPATPRSSHCRDPALSGTGHEHVRRGTETRALRELFERADTRTDG